MPLVFTSTCFIELDFFPVPVTSLFFQSENIEKRTCELATYMGSQLKRASSKHPTGTAMTVKEMTVQETMRWLREHLADFPVPDMAYQFEFNGKADAHERISHLPDEILQANEWRKERAQAVLDTYTGGFDGREGMNTLLCALYSPLAVSMLVRAAYADTDNRNRLAHVFVLRVGEVFLLLLTASPYKRFPLDWFMSKGQETSAYMWLNLKEACWEQSTPAAATPAAALKPVRKKQKTWQQLSAATVSGLHILSVFWRRAGVMPVNPPPALAAETAGVAPALNYVYVQPPPQALAVAGEDGAPDAWILKVESFAEQFTNIPPETQSPAVLVVEEPVVAPMAKEETVVAPMVEEETVVAPVVEGETVVSPI